MPVPAISSISSSLAVNKEQSTGYHANFYLGTEQLYLLGDKLGDSTEGRYSIFFLHKDDYLGYQKGWEWLSCHSRLRMLFFPISPLGKIGSIKQ